MRGRSRAQQVALALGCCVVGAAIVNGCSSKFSPDVQQTGPQIACPASSKVCGNSCVDVAFDPKNCGDCDQACAAGEVCSQGKCASSCTGGTKKCGDKCVDTLLDPHNCGECAKACAAEELCSAGKCGLSCVGGTKLCGASPGQKCVDTQIDAANCGDCGMACAANEACFSGKCGCAPSFTKCPAGCANLAADAKNCGACGVACTANEDCITGACLVKRLGTGADGDLVVSGGMTTVLPLTVSGTVYGKAGGPIVVNSAADLLLFKVGQTVLMHQSQNGDVGQWEITTVTGIDQAGLVNVTPPLRGSYKYGGAQAVVLPQYNNVTVQAGGTLTAAGWDGNLGGILAFQVKGKMDVQSGGLVTMAAKGYRGNLDTSPCSATCGAGMSGESLLGAGYFAAVPNQTGGGAGLGGDFCSMGGGGGYGTQGGTGVNNSSGTCKTSGNAIGGAAFGTASLTNTIVFGGAGGGGGRGAKTGLPGAGGNGGGIIMIFGNDLAVAGEIIATGGQGGHCTG